MKWNIAHPSFVEETCKKTREDLIPRCIEGMVSYHIVNFASPARTMEFCTTLDPSFKEICEKVVHVNERFFLD